jgi:hypothetical protein
MHFESPLTPAYGGIFDLYPSPRGERESFLLLCVSHQDSPNGKE